MHIGNKWIECNSMHRQETIISVILLFQEFAVSAIDLNLVEAIGHFLPKIAVFSKVYTFHDVQLFSESAGCSPLNIRSMSFFKFVCMQYSKRV